MNKVLIGMVCSVNPKIEGNLSLQQLCSFIPMEYVSDEFGTITRQSIRPVAEVIKGYTFFRENDVLFAKITPCMENGKIAIAKNLKNGFGFGSTEFHVLRANEGEITPHWIFYFLRQDKIRKDAERRMTGSAGQQRVPTSFLEEELEIPLPSLPEQKRIAAILDKADRLRRQRRYAQALSDSFLQSIFIKMFGDHLKQDYPKTELINLVTITGGGTPSREIEEYFKGKIAWLTSKDMKGDYIFDTEEHITEEAIKNSATKLVPKGSILLVVKSKVLMHRLPIAVAEIPLCHGQDIKSIQCSEKVNPLFLVFILKHNERNLLNQARGANTEGLTLPMLESIPVPKVPLPLQEQFAAIVQKFERIRRQQREATRQAEHLFQTLLHRAFRGEL